MRSFLRKTLSETSVPGVFEAARIAYGISRSVKRGFKLRRPHGEGQRVKAKTGFAHSFCGYYDHSPFLAEDESVLLVHSTDASILRAPDPKKPAAVSAIDWRSGREIERLGESRAWNWQQGCRALWLGGQRWIYNRFSEQRGEYVSITGGLGCTERQELPWPVQEVSPTGMLYSLNYAVLAALRPDYGYFNRPLRQGEMDRAGIIEFSPDGADSRQIVEIRRLREDAESRHRKHIQNYKINHILSSPCGNYIIFMFRYYIENKRVTDVYTHELHNGITKILFDNKYVSHYCWLNQRNILFTGKINEEFGYYIMDILKNKPTKVLTWADGHPAKTSSEQFITDTYADTDGVKSLWRVDMAKEVERDVETTLLGEFVEPWYLWGGRRCDLHPSPSPSARYWQVDSISAGRRTPVIGALAG